MLRLKMFKNRPKNGENEGEEGRFKIIPMLKKRNAFDPPQRALCLGKKEFNLLHDDELNDVGKLMNLSMFFHLRMMKNICKR